MRPRGGKNMKKSIVIMAVFALLATSVLAHSCPKGAYWAGDDEIAYANAVAVTSGSVTNAQKAVGEDDNRYAYLNKAGSYIVLDMGEGEEVWDRLGFDFKVYQDNSREFDVDIYVSNQPNAGWEYVGSTDGKGDDELSIAFTSYQSVRYVKIKSDDWNEAVEVDAVSGYCISEPTPDGEAPEFGTVGAALVLAGAGAYLSVKRKKN